MYLVDEYNDVWILLQLVQQCLDALLELSAILRSGYDRCHIETEDALVEQQRRGASAGDKLGKTFGYGTLANAWFADKYRVVLLSTAQNLGDTLYLLVATDYEVELTLGCSKCEVGRELVKHRCLVCSAAHWLVRCVRSSALILVVM